MPALTDEQRAIRATFIGGSDAPSICGVNPWRSAHDVYLDKIGQGKPVIENEAMYWGTAHEATIATRYSEVTGRTLLVRPDTILHPRYPYIGCHLDRSQRDHHIAQGREGVVEIKTTRKYLKKGECPDSYQVQLYHNMLCTGTTWGTVVILIQGSEMVWYDYHLTPQIESSILTLEARFWKAVTERKWEVFGCM